MSERFFDPSVAHQQLLHFLSEINHFGETECGGIARLAASKEDGQARDYLCDWFEKNGFKTPIDPVGNIFGLIDLGQGDPEQYFFCGSHLDSQPEGGKYDGTLGVVAACLAGLVIKEQVDAGLLKPRFRYYVAVSWTNEEGARFQPSLLGSSSFVGTITTSNALSAKDADDITLEEALTAIGYKGTADIPKPCHYFELHIEQGPELDATDIPVGIVSGSWGAKKVLLEISGELAHTGPTPMEDRKDALLAAARVIVSMGEIPKKLTETVYTSVGRIEASPNSPNTVADTVNLWIEMRSSDTKALAYAEQIFEADLKNICKATQCNSRIVSSEYRPVVPLDKDSTIVIKETFLKTGIPFRVMLTIAGHDAIRLQSLCPSTLLFIPSKDGISHSPAEFSTDKDICAGFDAMLIAMTALIALPSQKETIVADKK